MAEENGTTATEEAPAPAAPKRATTRKRPAAKTKDEPTKSPYKLFKVSGKTFTLVAEVEAESAEAAREVADEKNGKLKGDPLTVVATRNMKSLATETVTRTRVKVV